MSRAQKRSGDKGRDTEGTRSNQRADDTLHNAVSMAEDAESSARGPFGRFRVAFRVWYEDTYPPNVRRNIEKMLSWNWSAIKMFAPVLLMLYIYRFILNTFGFHYMVMLIGIGIMVNLQGISKKLSQTDNK